MPQTVQEHGDVACSDRHLAAVLDGLEIERAVLGGVSMGAATTLAFALEHPERVDALIQITPAHLGSSAPHSPTSPERWDELADGLERLVHLSDRRAHRDPQLERRR